ncbi:hypothetical protein [Pseudomonas aeruginosa]|uniref:hypothetical protein n=1 Tax=Pseudomonas aeruginosa TaxID=287 RepID=UPI001F4B3508|nr:hypothetical protein [Pseudomonas aeruginosa]MCS7693308.1 hypothetical protein [Pseudomonas aeruginosa]MDE9747880.1 hypothetical protein [Pseudomonas aeruginosa]HCE7942323.1 hypothetical protein [Pseudomonas aeruginosa]HCF0264817.1 hypothetical protein [Pseudomonas aeruginosa]
MHPSLQQALDIITVERNAVEYAQAFAAVHDVVSVFGEHDLANRLFAELPRTVPEELVAELFNLLAWQTNDNGAAMAREVETWLREGQDVRKLTIAMGLDVYPFPDAQEMYQVLSTLASSTPEVAARCQILITSRKASAHS